MIEILDEFILINSTRCPGVQLIVILMQVIIKVKVEQEAIDYVEQLYAPPDNPVFELVPATFAHYTQILYDKMGSPPGTGENVWDIYRELVNFTAHCAQRYE
jgi:hypothetical protein